jgi:hypothetical protein
MEGLDRTSISKNHPTLVLGCNVEHALLAAIAVGVALTPAG